MSLTHVQFEQLSIIYIIIICLYSCEPLPLYIYHGDVSISWHDADAFCMFSYGTQLASIHNIDQQIEAELMCSDAVSSNECWIGANDITTDSKWIESAPLNDNEYCAFIQHNCNNRNSQYDDCHTKKHLLCNYPSSASTYSAAGLTSIDILDEIYLDFDFMPHSLYATNKHSAAAADILYIGAESHIGLQTTSTPQGLALRISFASVHKTVFTDLVVLNNWHHVEVSVTQNTLAVQLNGTQIYSDSNMHSHSILMQQQIYMDGLWKNINIQSNNAYMTPFNYLCDANHRFTPISGARDWSIDESYCWLSQNIATGDAHITWLGAKDPASIQWRDYKIAFIVNIVDGNAINDIDAESRSGLLFRAQSASSYYYLSIQNNKGIQLSKIDHDTSHDLHTYHTSTIHYNEDYMIRVEVLSDRFTVYCDNKQVFSYSDTMYKYGSIGLRTFRAAAIFKHLRIIHIGNHRRHLLTARVSRALECGDHYSGIYKGKEAITFTHSVASRYDVMFDTKLSTFIVTDILVYSSSTNEYVLQQHDHNGIVSLTLDAGDYIFSVHGATEGTFDVQMTCFSFEPTTSLIVTSDSKATMDVNHVHVIESQVYALLSLILLFVGGLCFCVVCLCMLRSKKKKKFTRSATMMRFEQRQQTHAPELEQTYSVLEARAQRSARVDKWLTKDVRLPEYVPNFINNGYESLDIIQEIEKTFELEEIGITRSAHQMIILSQIRKLNNKQKAKPQNKPIRIIELNSKPQNKAKQDAVIEQVVIKVTTPPMKPFVCQPQNMQYVHKKNAVARVAKKPRYRYQGMKTPRNNAKAQKRPPPFHVQKEENISIDDDDDDDDDLYNDAFWTYGAPETPRNEEEEGGNNHITIM